MNQIDAAAFAVSALDEAEEPPSSPRRHPLWKDVPLEQWEDWRWQMQNAVRTTSQVAELLPHTPQEIAALERLEVQYKLAIPPYYFSLINVDDPHDPIRLQSVPSPLELVSASGQALEDPLEEDKDSPVPGLTHRYPDRVLMVTTHVCSMYCRFCTRKRVTMDRDGWDGPSHNDQRMVQYVREHSEIHDVIVSGGDPLSLPVSKLRWFLNELSGIEHVDIIRIGTRVPVTLPQRLFDPDLIELLHSANKIWIQTHFNHPNEITPETTRACRNLVNAGMPVSNHAVLLKGVNDSVETMRQLMRGLLRIKVRPYYLFHCDPVVGAGHFRTSIWKGLEIIEGLRGHISGLGVPTYVVDGLHGAGKIPLMPNYLVSASDRAVVLRNYEGLLFRYAPEDRVDGGGDHYPSLGVSNLLSGNAGALVPEGTPRYQRRQQQAEEAAPPTNGLHVVGTPHRSPPSPANGHGHFKAR
jgi:lysine 2,3-aminomutase